MTDNSKIKGMILKTKEAFSPVLSIYHYYNKCRENLPIDEKMVLLESYQGSRMTCNSLAIFERMKSDPAFKDFKYVWALTNKENEGLLPYKDDKSVEFCKLKSKKYYKYLATAKYLVNNKTYPYSFIKRDEQVHISTWHGIPLKTLGKQQFGSMGQYKNVARNIINTDYLVMPDKFTADTFLECCDATHLYQGTVIDAGYPRVDFTVNSDYNEMRALLKKLVGIDTSKKLVLYAPTWRGEVGNVKDTTKTILKNLKELVKVMPKDYQLLLKIHDRTYAYLNEHPELKEMQNAPDWLDTSKLLAAVDILITDYSSIYFDFLNTGRPILFFTYDREEYESTRGLYFSLDEDLPGPLCYTAADVANAIEHMDEIQEAFKEKIETVKKRHCYNDDGHATERVIDIIFKNKSLEYAYKIEPTKKTRLLINAGSLVTNPINNVLIDLINEIDLEKYEITLLYDKTNGNRDDFYLKKLNSEIKIIYRVPLEKDKLRNAIIRHGYENYEAYPKFTGKKLVERYRKMYFNENKFDIALDMAGVRDFWHFVISNTSYKKKIVLMSNKLDIKQSVQNFDDVIFYDESLYSEALEIAKEQGHKLSYLTLPVSFNNFLSTFKSEMVYELSKIKTFTEGVNKDKKEIFFNEFVNKYKTEMGKEVDECLSDLKAEIKTNKQFKVDYEEAVASFLQHLNGAKEETENG